MKNSTVASVHHLSYVSTSNIYGFGIIYDFLHFDQAKRTSSGYFLVVVTMIAICMRCIMGALKSRIFKDLEPRDSEEKCHDGNKKTLRWKTALLDLRDAEKDEYVQQLTENEDEIESDDISHLHTYGKLEEDYQKFLSECGISNCGYWRGGSSK